MVAAVRRASPYILKTALILLGLSLTLTFLSYAITLGTSAGRFGIAMGGGSAILVVASDQVTYSSPAPGTGARPVWTIGHWPSDSFRPPAHLPWVIHQRVYIVAGGPEELASYFVILDLPLWCVASLVGLFSLLAWWLFRRVHREVVEGGCISCGYSLRGTPAGAACPECGRKPLAKRRGTSPGSG